MNSLLESLMRQGAIDQPDPPALLTIAVACLFLARAAVHHAVVAALPRRGR